MVLEKCSSSLLALNSPGETEADCNDFSSFSALKKDFLGPCFRYSGWEINLKLVMGEFYLDLFSAESLDMTARLVGSFISIWMLLLLLTVPVLVGRVVGFL